MKLVINYDFFNAILDVNQDFIPMKIIRNNKKSLAIYDTLVFAFDYFIIRNIPASAMLTMIQNISFYGVMYCVNYHDGIDVYKEKGIKRLKELVIKLNEQYINTDYNLLLKSELISKDYKISLNGKIPSIFETKYLLVPTYDFNNNIKNTSIMQEHEVGSNEYILSLGSKQKSLQFARASV